MAPASHLIPQLTTSLSTILPLPPSPAWLSTFLSSQKPTTPLSSLLATAKIRLLNSDITTSLTAAAASNSAAFFPPDIHDATIKERRLAGPIVVQVLGVEDMTKSRWSQVEAIEARERGEGTRGREVVRVVPSGTATDGDQGAAVEEGAGGEGAECKLLLQDARGKHVWGLEFKAVRGVKVGMGIGTKVRRLMGLGIRSGPDTDV